MHLSIEDRLLTVLYLLCCFGDLSEANLYGNYSGDIILAAFFPVHHRRVPDGVIRPELNPDACGVIQEQDGIQAVEAFYYALDQINRDPDLLRGFRLGAVVLDSCDDDTHALGQGMELIRVLMSREDLSDLPYRCMDGAPPTIVPGVAGFYKSVAIVGGASSSVSIQLASLLKLVAIPQVSYMSTTPDLGNTDRYPYFKRTVPSDVNQAKAIIAILKEFSWTYVSVVYEDSNYGLKGYAELQRAAKSQGICFSYTRRIDFDESDWGPANYEEILQEMSPQNRYIVTVLWAYHPRAEELLAAADRLNRTDIIWIGSDGWSGRTNPVAGRGHVVNHTITVQPMAFQIPGFDDYFEKLHPLRNDRNPWFTEYWENHFKCNLPTTRIKLMHPSNRTSYKNGTINAEESPLLDTIDSVIKCTGEEKIGRENGYIQQMTLHFICDAAYAYAHALTAMHNKTCAGQPGLCLGMNPTNVSGAELLQYLSTVNFKSTSGRPFAFLHDIDGPPRYTIMTYRQEAGNFTWTCVGNYSGVDGEEGLRLEPVFRDVMVRQSPPLACSMPCASDQARQYVKGERCCWVCSNCTEWQIVVRGIDLGGDDMCFSCFKGMWPSKNRTTCIDIDIEAMAHTDPWAIACMALSLFFIVWAGIVLAVYLVYHETPVIKASGRELSYYLMGAIFVSYFSTFVFVARPTKGTCAMTRLLLGLTYTGVYAPILTKATRISRIFNNDAARGTRKAWLTSPRAQLLIVSLLVAVQVLVLSVWLAAANPKTKFTYPERHLRVLVCSGAENETYLIALIYPFLMILLCIVYAFKTRKTPDGFNETRLIAFTSYTTIVIWLAFVPIYFLNAGNNAIRTTTLCVSVSLNATVALSCLLMPRVYVCLFRPEKNTREAVMTRSQSIISSGSAVINTVDPLKTGGTGDLRRHSNLESTVSNQSCEPSLVSMDPTAAKLTPNTTTSSLLPSLTSRNSTPNIKTCNSTTISQTNTLAGKVNHPTSQSEPVLHDAEEQSDLPKSGGASWRPQSADTTDAGDVTLDFSNGATEGARQPVVTRRVSIATLKNILPSKENGSPAT